MDWTPTMIFLRPGSTAAGSARWALVASPHVTPVTNTQQYGLGSGSDNTGIPEWIAGELCRRVPVAAERSL
jgi:hypothetical protein